MNYCSTCGALVSFRVPEGDNLPRFVCDSCDTVHYQNPKIVAGSIVDYEGKTLLCKRAIEPRSGLWTIPAGFMELGETTNAAAIRETLEEAQAEIKIIELFAVYNIPRVSQVYIIFRSRMPVPEFAPGEESLEVKLFSEDEIPWDKLAFPVVTASLRKYFEKSKNGNLKPYVDHIL